MCAGLIRPLQGTFYAITTELEKSIPSLATCAIPPMFELLYTIGLAQRSLGSQILEDFFRAPVGIPPLGGPDRKDPAKGGTPTPWVGNVQMGSAPVGCSC